MPIQAGTAVLFRVLVGGEAPGAAHGLDVDPFGHRWNIAQRVRDVTPEEIAAGAAKAFGSGRLLTPDGASFLAAPIAGALLSRGPRASGTDAAQVTGALRGATIAATSACRPWAADQGST